MIRLVLFAALASSPPSDVRLSERTDPITGARQVFLILGPQERRLQLGCTEEGSPRDFIVRVRGQEYIGRTTVGVLAGGTDVSYRFDQGTVFDDRWEADGAVVTASSPRSKPALFAARMRNTNSVTIRLVDQEGRSHDLSFAYPGASPSIDELLTRCGLDPLGRPLKSRKQ